MKYKLHCFAQSGNAYKVALMLSLCDADWEPIFVDFFNGETQTDAFRKKNEFGEVPVLEAGELRLSQSGVILDYLAEEFDSFDADNIPQHREILRWLFFDNHKLTSNIATLRYLLQFTDQGEGEVTEFLRKRAISALKIVNQRLSESEFIIGERVTIADISMCGYLFWPEELGIEWQGYDHIDAWLARIKALPGWVHPYELMPGYPMVAAKQGANTDANTDANTEAN